MKNFDRLLYDPNSGVFTWINPTANNVKAGSIAGSTNSHGYSHIKYDGNNYKAHRLAWYITHGRWPIGQIDHIDGNRLNNSIANLRDVSIIFNAQNQRSPHKRNTSGFIGVSWHKQNSKWQARIRFDGKIKYLGLFQTPKAAYDAYLTAKRKLHEGCTI